MKKAFSKIRRACVALMAVVLVLGLMAPIAVQADGISVTIDGVAVVFEDQTPVIIDGRTLVPVGGVFGALNFVPTWDGDAQTATLTRDDFTVVITIGSADFTTNGVVFTLDVPAQIIEGRTMLPLRAVLESIGIPSDNIGWDGDAQAITVVTDGEVAATDPAPVEDEPAPTDEPPADDAPATGSVDTNTALVGTWDWQMVPGTTSPWYVLNADNTGTMLDAPILWWTSNGVFHTCSTPDLCGTPAGCILPTTWYYELSGNTLELASTLVETMRYTYVRR